MLSTDHETLNLWAAIVLQQEPCMDAPAQHLQPVTKK